MAGMAKEDREKLRGLLGAPQPAVAPHSAAASTEELLVAHHERRRAQAEEWGQWVATGPIFIGNARAFNEDDPVPHGHVEKFHLEEAELVERVRSAADARKLTHHPLDAMMVGPGSPEAIAEAADAATTSTSAKRGTASK